METEIRKSIENLFISSIYPNCPKKHLCDKGQGTISKKTKMPFIGWEYDNNPQIPNLLFISLDSGCEYQGFHTIDEIRNQVILEPPRLQKGKDTVLHWYQTFDIATILLDKYIDESKKTGVAYVDSLISHTNSAKCTQSKDGNSQADGHFFDNCFDFLKIEIPLYRADIIVTQGNRAFDCLSGNLVIEKILLETSHNGMDVKFPIFIREVNNRKVLHIPMYHPSYYKGYWGNKKVIIDNINKIKEITDLIRSERMHN